MIAETKLQRASNDNSMIPCMEVVLTREDGLKADLLYSTVDETGTWLEEPGKRSPYDEKGRPLREGNLAARLTHRMCQMPYANEAYDDAINYRIQILAAARGGLGTEQRRQVQRVFRQPRALIAEQFIVPSSTPTPTPKLAPTYEPLPNSTPDATSKALEAAQKENSDERSSASEATQKALQSAIKESSEERGSAPDATQKALQSAIRDRKEAEEKHAIEKKGTKSPTE